MAVAAVTETVGSSLKDVDLSDRRKCGIELERRVMRLELGARHSAIPKRTKRDTYEYGELREHNLGCGFVRAAMKALPGLLRDEQHEGMEEMIAVPVQAHIQRFLR